ncbi:MAG: hypothetical protein NZM36_07190, partial [Aquificaceae bacterium]|nr:hypothetical protein [Aquificaceae bacterium]
MTEKPFFKLVPSGTFLKERETEIKFFYKEWQWQSENTAIITLMPTTLNWEIEIFIREEKEKLAYFQIKAKIEEKNSIIYAVTKNKIESLEVEKSFRMSSEYGETYKYELPTSLFYVFLNPLTGIKNFEELKAGLYTPEEKKILSLLKEIRNAIFHLYQFLELKGMSREGAILNELFWSSFFSEEKSVKKQFYEEEEGVIYD